MYCQNCGIYNPDESKVCQICRTELVCEEKPDEVRISVDLTQYPLKALLRSWRGVNPLLMIFFVPIITLLWCFRKVFRKPFFTTVMNGCHPKFHISCLEQAEVVHKKSLNAAMSFLTQKGFELFADLEDFNMSQGAFQRLMANREKSVFATIHITRATGKVSYITFSAITRDKTLVSLSNTYGIPIRYPKNLMIRHVPDLSLNALYEEFLRCLSQAGSESVMLPLGKLLPLTYKVSCFSIQSGLRQGFFFTKGAEKSGEQSDSASTCFFHPFNAAVRKCSGCGTALCEACYTPWGAHDYCEKCLVSKKAESPEQEKASLPGVPEGFGFAGFGLRSAAALIDISFVCLLTAAVFTGIYYSASFYASKCFPLSVLVSQIFFVGFSLYYLTVPARRFGRTLGQKMLGLQMIDRDGNLPDTVAAVIRAAYHLFSCLFIFPMIGYLFILFRKRKQGFHDQLSDTFVITMPSRAKSVISWIALFFIFIGAGGFGVHKIMPIITMFRSDFKQEMALEQKWTYPDDSDKLWDYAVLGDRCIVSTTACLSALDTRTGEILWTAGNLAATSVYAPLEKEGTRLVLLKADKKEEKKFGLFCIDSESGAVLWESAVEAEEPAVIFDSQSVLVHGADLVQEYDLNGILLWEQRFQDKFKIEYIETANKNILLARYSDSATDTEMATTLTYIERFSGKIRWEEKNSVHHPGYAPGNGYQFFYKDKGETALMYMPEQKFVWESPENILVTAHDEDKSSAVPFRFYTWKSGLLAGHGAKIFSYPPDTQMGCLTDAFIVLLPEKTKGNFRQGVRGKMLLADKITGELKASYEEDTWLSVACVAEDASAIYLLARVSESNAVNSEILLINKNTLELKRIYLGKNIPLPKDDCKVFPQQQLVFIPTSVNIGGYALPLPQN